MVPPLEVLLVHHSVAAPGTSVEAAGVPNLCALAGTGAQHVPFGMACCQVKGEGAGGQVPGAAPGWTWPGLGMI